jgi:hypothetical protein
VSRHASSRSGRLRVAMITVTVFPVARVRRRSSRHGGSSSAAPPAQRSSEAGSIPSASRCRSIGPARAVRTASTQPRSGFSASSANATQPIGWECSRMSTNSVRPEQGGPTTWRKVARPSVSSTSATPTGPPTSRSVGSPPSGRRLARVTKRRLAPGPRGLLRRPAPPSSSGPVRDSPSPAHGKRSVGLSPRP